MQQPTKEKQFLLFSPITTTPTTHTTNTTTQKTTTITTTSDMQHITELSQQQQQPPQQTLTQPIPEPMIVETPQKNFSGFLFPSADTADHTNPSSSNQDNSDSQQLTTALASNHGLNLSLNPAPVQEQQPPVLLAPLAPKKKRELNLFLPVAIIEKQEKEIPLPTGGNTSKKAQNIFHFYDNFHEFTVFCDVAMKKCSRENQEDRFSAVNPLDTDNNRDAFFAVFDGHGTSVIADTLKERLHSYIRKNEHYHSDIILAIKQSFSQIDAEILKQQKEHEISSGGSTALCCLIKEDNLYIINCGDSSSVLVSGPNNAVSVLNKLHKPSQKEEQARLISQNTLFTETRVIGTLAVTRALGDYKLKDYINSEPEITVYKIDQNSKYLFLGTDGFWDIINYEKDLPGLLLERERTSCLESIKDLSTFLVENASNRITTQKKDNMTLLAVDLNWFYQQCIEGNMSDEESGDEDNNDNDNNQDSIHDLISNQMDSICDEKDNLSSINNLGYLQKLPSINSSSVLVCSKSQFRINTEISSFLFQAKSPHSVGRNLDKRSSLGSSLNKSKNSGIDDSINLPTCSKKPIGNNKKPFFNYEDDIEQDELPVKMTQTGSVIHPLGEHTMLSATEKQSEVDALDMLIQSNTGGSKMTTSMSFVGTLQHSPSEALSFKFDFPCVPLATAVTQANTIEAVNTNNNNTTTHNSKLKAPPHFQF